MSCSNSKSILQQHKSMYPHDNIFNIYYNIGKRTPFLVKRCELGLARSSSEDRRIDPNRDRTFLVETVKPRGKYGKAYGKCFVDGKPDDTYRQECYPDIKDEEIPFSMCSKCFAINRQKQLQLQRKDFSMAGMVALVTGGRIKIGYQTALSLLRKGATVIITTRFPVDAAERYCKENDFQEWENRLLIYGIDFRDIRKVESMIAWMNARLPYLNILINNAAQTIARPEAYYQYLRVLENRENRRLTFHTEKELK